MDIGISFVIFRLVVFARLADFSYRCSSFRDFDINSVISMSLS